MLDLDRYSDVNVLTQDTPADSECKSRNTKIISNNVSLNSGTGIHLDLSSHNEIYLNDFINNSPNVVSFRSSNNWNSSSKITYTYNDNAYTN